MAVGSSAVNLANKWLNVLGQTTFTAPAGTYVKLHIGDPGSAGATNSSSVTTRPAVTWAAASGGSVASSNTPSWATWAGTSPEVVTHISVWDAAPNGTGNFLFSAALSASKTINTNDTLNLTSLSYALSPIAA
jgi:hypothetical protein